MADLQQSVVDELIFFQETADDGLFRIVAFIISQDFQTNFCGRLMRIAIDACGNTGERNGDTLFFSGPFETVDIA
jgi:hypothetical protein